jgi:hypothetical protein
LRSFIVGVSRAFTLHVAKCLVLCALLVRCLDLEAARGQEPGVDWAGFAGAAAFCRGDMERPMSLSPDKKILCYDGAISSDQDVSSAKDLADQGLFVVRSFGGEASVVMALADLLRERRATVVIYDYCFSACAAFLLIASNRTFVLKGSIVAWHHRRSGVQDCPSLQASTDGGPQRLETSPCPEPPVYLSKYYEVKALLGTFLAKRVVDTRFELPPESFAIRKILKNMFAEKGIYPNVMWLWNPRYYRSTIKTEVVYERYPESQDEVDDMMHQLHLPLQLRRVIYDP